MSLSNERKQIPNILNGIKAVAYKQGIKDCLDLVEEQDKQAVKELKEELFNNAIRPTDNMMIDSINKIFGEELTKEKIAKDDK